MTGVKISTLPAASAATATDQLEVNQAGVTRRITVGQIAAIGGGSAAASPYAYGGLGTGSGDDSAAVAAAIASGQAVDLSDGIWPIKDLTISSSTTCPGIFSDGSGEVRMAAGGTPTTMALTISKSDFYVENIFFNMPYTGVAATTPPTGDRALYFRNDAGGGRWRVENCRFYGGGHGLAQGGPCDDLKFINNTFDDIWAEAIIVDNGEDILIDGNTVRNCSFDSTGLSSGGMRIGVSTQTGVTWRCNVINNTVYRCGLNSGQEAIDFAGACMQQLIVSGNKLIECGNGGFEAKTFLQTASFTGTIAGTTLTVSGLTGTPIVRNQVVTGVGVAPGTTIVSGGGTTWTVSISQTVGPVAMTSALDPDSYAWMLFANNYVRLLGDSSTIGFNIHLTGAAPGPPQAKAGKVVFSGNYVGCETMPDRLSGTVGIILTGFSDTSITGNTFKNIARGVEISNALNATSTISRISVNNNVMDCSGVGINVAGTAAAGSVDDLRIIGNDIRGGDNAIVSATAVLNNLYIGNNYLENTLVEEAMELRNIQGGWIVRNTLVSRGNNTILVQGTASNNLRILQNDIRMVGATPSPTFLINAGTGHQIYDNVVDQPDTSNIIGGTGSWTAYGNKRNPRTTTPQGSVTGSLGDIVPNAAPTAAGVIGWVCTTAGSVAGAVWKGLPVNA